MVVQVALGQECQFPLANSAVEVVILEGDHPEAMASAEALAQASAEALAEAPAEASVEASAEAPLTWTSMSGPMRRPPCRT